MKFISFSGGVESSTMCVLYGNQANAIFADTGFEHDLMYDRLDKVEKAIREFHNNDFKIIRVKNQDHGSLEGYIKESKFYPSFQARYCTRMFKIEPIDDYLKAYQGQDVELMIGLNYDEKDSRVGNQGKLSFVNYAYPLIEGKINRAMCEKILERLDLLPNFPPYMLRGGCKGCYHKGKKEYEAMLHLKESEFDEVMVLDEDIQDIRGAFYSIKSDIPEGLRKFKSNILKQVAMVDFKEIYNNPVKLTTQCGIFCHR
jgi:hypothetical protein